MIQQLCENVYSINVPLPGNPLRNLNSFFIRGSQRDLLIDTGFNMKESLEGLTTGLKELNADMDSTDIFITHLHSDHAGLAPAVASPSSKVYMSRIDYEIYRQFKTPEYFKKIDDCFLSFGFSKNELQENKSLNPAMIYLPDKDIEYKIIENEDVIDLGTCSLECLHTPGHTPGHICLYDREHKYLFSGDHILFGISPNITSWPDVPDSLGSYLQSLEKIRKMDIKRTFSAHRQIEGDSSIRIDELIEHHKQRLAEAQSIVERRTESTVYQVASEMTWSIRAKNWEDFPVAQKWFAVGEAHSHLEYLQVRNKIKAETKNNLILFSAN